MFGHGMYFASPSFPVSVLSSSESKICFLVYLMAPMPPTWAPSWLRFPHLADHVATVTLNALIPCTHARWMTSLWLPVDETGGMFVLAVLYVFFKGRSFRQRCPRTCIVPL
jgi:hypothetical protein